MLYAAATSGGVIDARENALFCTVVILSMWQGHAGQVYLDELHDLHRYMAPYAALSDDDRRKVDNAILNIIDRRGASAGKTPRPPTSLASGDQRFTAKWPLRA